MLYLRFDVQRQVDVPWRCLSLCFFRAYSRGGDTLSRERMALRRPCAGMVVVVVMDFAGVFEGL
jgi:hypothetical protein